MHDGAAASAAHEEPTDAELMAATREGDRAAFGRLVDRHKDRLVAYLGRLTGSPERAEDLAQEAFLRLYESAGRYAERGRLGGLLYAISVNLLRSEERRARRRRALSVLLPLPGEAAAEPAAPAALLARERERQLARALAALPLAYRVPLVLAEVEGWSHREIAAHLGCREGTVKSRLHRGRERLRRKLAPYWNEGRETSHGRPRAESEPATPA
ncbi:MAG TPA: RNA polymerase sigma factor [Thermoanaerobaculia bacterium]|nr:RNA polymerase sigma factor [Thermoanaerobaculia bacterium]